MTRVLVCGGRHFDDRILVSRTLAPFKPVTALAPSVHLIIHGAAPGADTLADEWANVFGVPSLAFPARWRQHGKAAGPIRNQRMIDEGKPDVVIAFPGGSGTADMVRRARAAGITVIEPTGRTALAASDGDGGDG